MKDNVLLQTIKEAALGPHTLLDQAMPAGIDGSVLLTQSLEEGITAGDVIAQAANRIGQLNEEIVTRFGRLMMTTESGFAYYRGGSGNHVTPRRVELTNPDAVRGSMSGHILPRHDMTDLVAWDPDWLRRANRMVYNAALDVVANGWENRVEIDIFTRVFTNTEEPVGIGFSPGWAIGQGTNTNFIPPSVGGKTFSRTHTHYTRVNAALDATTAKAALIEAALNVAEHGHTGRKFALVSSLDTAIYRAMDGFAPVIPNELTVIGGSPTAPLAYINGEMNGVPGELIGMLPTDGGLLEIYPQDRIPAGYMAVGKSYGVLDNRNPIAARVEPDRGFGMLVYPQITRDLSPAIAGLEFRATHGIGANDRTSVAVTQVAAGGSSYVNPTIE